MANRSRDFILLIFLMVLFGRTEIGSALQLSSFEPQDGQRIGFFTGTFNPVHTRHAEIAEGLLAQGLLDAIIMVPNDMTYHKSSVIHIHHRIRMLELQFEDTINVFVPDSADFGGNKMIPMELRLRSYLHSLNPELKYFGIMGADCVDSKSVRFAVKASRFFSSQVDHIKHWYISTADDPKQFPFRTEFFGDSGEYVHIPTANEIHSTKIRKYFENPERLTKTQEHVIGSIKPKVAEYILQEGLYLKYVDKTSKAKKMVLRRGTVLLVGGALLGWHMIDLAQLPSQSTSI